MAIFLSFIIPGLGQFYNGRRFHGVAWLVVVVAGYVMLIFPGLIMHFFCLLDAGREFWQQKRMQNRKTKASVDSTSKQTTSRSVP